MLQHASTDDTEGHAWPMSSCISLKGQALPGHPFSPTAQLSQFNCHNSIVTIQLEAVRAAYGFLRDLHALHTYRCRPRRLRFGIKLRQWAQKCIFAMPVRQRIDRFANESTRGVPSSSHTRMKRLRSSYENQSQHLSVCMRT